MENTGRFELPLILPSQAQKHVTHNEALTLLDGLIHLVIKTSGDISPPVGALVDDAFLVGPSASGAWFGADGKIAFNTDAGWRFCAPTRGIIAFFAADNELRIYEQNVWTALGDFVGSLSFPTLGVNTTADVTNRLAVRSNNALFTALEAGSGGNGDIQIKLNKESAGDTASFLYQTNYSGRAEVGLNGDDDLSIKVSPNGSAWQTAIRIDRTTAVVTLADNSIGNTALGDMASGRIKGRSSAGSGDPQDLTPAQVTAMLDLFTNSLKGLVPNSGGGTSNFLRADGTWTTPAGGSAGATAYLTTLDFGTSPVFSKTFTFAHAGASVTQKVMMSPSAVMPGLLLPDELELDSFSVAARVSAADTIQVVISAIPGPVSGLRNFNYLLL